ncbi:MAG: Mrp/NBP35 family ATP-binding protein [Elusimicrobia bacterium]|nr:Mrp/NBP35 family ATP-binding protein [Elusimicrobiota bacterium]
MPVQSDIFEALSQVQDPDLHRDIVSLGMIQDLKVDGGSVSFDFVLTTPACPVRDQLQEQARQAVMGVKGVTDVAVNMKSNTYKDTRLEQAKLPDIKNIIAVGSGKGGVGKSTVAVNLAVTLTKLGAKVGLLDADFYGPNQPQMLGIDRAALIPDENNKIAPPENYGVKLMSIGFFLEGDNPVMWRGPMLHGALTQFLHDVRWGDIDYLIIDLPPGTGDVQITLVQNVPLTGAILVTTPQTVALSDVRKTIRMFEKAKTNVLGVIENMSGFICPHCEKLTKIFAEGGGQALNKDYGVELLGQIPLDAEICRLGETGKPIAASNPQHPISQIYRDIATRMAAKISTLDASAVVQIIQT